MLPETTWARIVAPLNKPVEEPSPKVCLFYGRTGCAHGDSCQFTHIQDPEALREYWTQRRWHRLQLRKLRRLQREEEERMRAAPVFVPATACSAACLVADSARLLHAYEKLDWGGGPRYALSAGYPLPCWRFAHDRRCDDVSCPRPHYKPRHKLYWRAKVAVNHT